MVLLATQGGVGDCIVAALTIDGADGRQPGAHRGLLLRLLDALAAWQMRRSYCAISRAQTLKAVTTGVSQPSSLNERSSTSACDR
jgi:hypothetical protein